MIEKIRTMFPSFLGGQSKKADIEKYRLSNLSETELVFTEEYHRTPKAPLLMVLHHIINPLESVRNGTFDLKQAGLEKLGVSIKEVQADIENQASLIMHGLNYFKARRIKNPTYGDFVNHLQEIHEYRETLKQD